MAYDLVVIGGGSGGLTASIMAGRLGAKVLLVDRERLGGDCLHHGCVPSKALIASARRAHAVRTAGGFGLEVEAPRVDFRAVMARMRGIREDIGTHDSPEAVAEHGVEVAFGGARFLGPHRLRVGEREVQAKRVIIATGAGPRRIPLSHPAPIIDYTQLFDLEALPERLLVVGGGPIGCELGQAMGRLGARVTLLQRGPRLLPRAHPEASWLVQAALEDEGVEVHTGNPDAAGYQADLVLLAVGRRAHFEGLGLEDAGVAHTERGITVDEALRTSQSHIYAVGDCNGGPQFTHWAEHEARVATRNALFRGRAQRRAPLPAVTFTDPEVASVGPLLDDAGPGAEAHRVPMDKVDRAVCDGRSEGFLEVVVDAKGRAIGAHAVGHGAGELLPEWVLAIRQRLRLRDVGAAIHAYPTLTRANRRAADERFFAKGLPGWQRRLFGRF